MRGPAAKREISKYWIFFAWYHKWLELKFSWSKFQTKEKMFFRNFLVTAHVIQQLNSPHPLAYAIAKHQFKSSFIA